MEANQLVLDEIEGELQTPKDDSSIYTGKIDINENVAITNSEIIGPDNFNIYL